MVALLFEFVMLFLFKCYPSINYLFDSKKIAWITPADDPEFSHILRKLSNWIIIVYVAIATFCYLTIFLFIKASVTVKFLHELILLLS